MLQNYSKVGAIQNKSTFFFVICLKGINGASSLFYLILIALSSHFALYDIKLVLEIKIMLLSHVFQYATF